MTMMMGNSMQGMSKRRNNEDDNDCKVCSSDDICNEGMGKDNGSNGNY